MPTRIAGREPLRDLGGQAQRVQPDDAHDRRLDAHELAGRDEALGDDAVEGRADHGVLQVAIGAVERRLARGDLGEQVTRRGERRCVGGPGRFELGLRAFELLCGEQVLGGELLGAGEPLFCLRLAAPAR